MFLKKLLHSIRNILTNNLGWKIVSFIIAVIMWFIVVNNANPITSKRFLIPLRLENIETLEKNNYVLLNGEQISSMHVELYVRASKSIIENLSRDPGRINAYIDFAPIDISHTSILGEPLPISIFCSLPMESAEIVQQSPRTVNITLDRFATKTMLVVLDKVGELKPGYVDLPGKTEPSQVTVSGPKSYVDQVATVKMAVDVSNASEDLIASGELRAFDETGKDITGSVTLSHDSANATVPVKKFANVRIANPVIKGNVAPGYVINNITMEPRYIEVVGTGIAIDSVKPIILDPINVENLKETKSFSFDLRPYFLNTDLSIKNFSPYVTVVTVNLEKETEKTYTISTDKIQVEGTNRTVYFETENVEFKLKGVERYHNNEITLTVDMTDLAPGMYNLPVKVNAGYGLTLQGTPPSVSVTLLEE